MTDALPEPKVARQPRVFNIDDPSIVGRQVAEHTVASGPQTNDDNSAATLATDSGAGISRGFGWIGLLVSAVTGLAVLAAGLWFMRFVSIAIGRDDWVGWTALALLGIGGLAAAVILLRETVGLWRLGRLAGLRAQAVAALDAKDFKAEQSVIGQLTSLYKGRADLAWGLSRFREHQGDVRDPGDLLALADRELIEPLDGQARRIVLRSSKRVAAVTALSPLALIAVGFVAVENLRMMRTLASLYGGRPGAIGALRLAKLVVGHLIATGGVALTDDLLGQFVGQDVLRRLSSRLGEGAFNGALTARLGTAAIDVIRPLPFIEAAPVRARDFVAELFRKTPAGTTRSEAKSN